MEKREPSYTVGGNINPYTAEYSVEIPTKLKIELPYDPAIPLLGIYPERNMTQKDTCTQCLLQSTDNNQHMEAS